MGLALTDLAAPWHESTAGQFLPFSLQIAVSAGWLRYGAVLPDIIMPFFFRLVTHSQSEWKQCHPAHLCSARMPQSDGARL